MINGKLKIAVLGLGSVGGMVIDSLKENENIQIVGIYDIDRGTVEEQARKNNAPFFTDYRSIIIESNPDAVFLATHPRIWQEIIQLCAEKGIHVWKKSPLARNLNEAVSTVRLMEKNNLVFNVACLNISGHYIENIEKKIRNPFHVRSYNMFFLCDLLKWEANRDYSEEGVLQGFGFQAIDPIIRTLGLPDEVYCLCSKDERIDSKNSIGVPEHLYNTEDSAVIILRFSRNCIGEVGVSRAFGPPVKEFHIHGCNGSISMINGKGVFRDKKGKINENFKWSDNPSKLLKEEIIGFIETIVRDRRIYKFSARENLLNQAVIEAAYLSSRTHQPESPHELLRTNGIDQEYCQRLSPSKGGIGN